MKCVYCSHCGTRLTLTRKALPKYGRIIDLVKPHECPDEPVEFDLSPIDVPAFEVTTEEGKGKFVQKLNELTEIPHDLHLRLFNDDGHIDNPGDRRKTEDIKSGTSSTAPRTLLDNMKGMPNSTPAHDVENEPKEE